MLNSGDCAVDGCDRPAVARGLCWRHYKRWQRTGLAVKPLVRKMCPSCCRWFEPRRSSQIFDSEACRVRWFRLRKRDPRLPARPDTVAHVARPTPPPQPRIRVVPFTRSQVIAKCHGRCVVCGEPVDLNALPGDPLSAVTAWSVPPAVCGEASLSNRVLVHEKCRPALEAQGKRGRGRRR